MQGLTLVVALVFSWMALSLKPSRAFAAYLVILFWYPSYLRISLGTIDISASRFIITVLLVRCLSTHAIKKTFQWHRLDTWVTWSMVVYTGVYALTRPLGMALENRSGYILDTWFVFLCARYCIRTRSELVDVLKILSIAIVPLMFVSAYEALTGHFLFLWLRHYCPWDPVVLDYDMRWGLHRSWGPFSHTIMFGCAFAMVLPLFWSLRKESGIWKQLGIWLTISAGMGAFFTVSSSVLTTLVVLVFALWFERHADYVKRLGYVLLTTYILGTVVFMVRGSTPFYRWLLARFSVGSGGWVWRAKLIECAMRDFPEWWFAGYKGVDPGWGAEGFLRFTDLTNEFVACGVYYGMSGLVVFCGTLYCSFKIIVTRYQKARTTEYRSMYWSFGVFMVGLIFLWTGVSFFGQPTMMFYAVLGMIGSSYFFKEEQGNIQALPRSVMA